MAPNTIYAKLMQGAKYLEDLGEEKYALWRSSVKILKRADHIVIKLITEFKPRDMLAPIFHPVEKDEKSNEWKDLYDWLEIEAEPAKDTPEHKSYMLYHKQKLNLSPEDIHYLNELFRSMPQFTARIKHDEIKVIRERIEVANIKP
jgi:hypothetical protein